MINENEKENENENEKYKKIFLIYKNELLLVQ